MKNADIEMKNLHSEEVDSDGIQNSFSVAVSAMIILNIVAVVLESVPSVELKFSTYFENFELFSVIIFAAEYVTRVYVVARKRGLIGTLRWAIEPMSLIDVVVFIPYLFHPAVGFDFRVLRATRLIRLFRIAKLGRHSKALRAMVYVLRSKAPDLAMTGFVAVILITISSTIIYEFEHDVQPDVFSSIPASMWWSVITLTTVGYGDIYPVTIGGKIFGAFTAFLGMGMVALPAGIIGSGFIELLKSDNRDKACANCPNCGAELNSSETKLPAA